MCANGIPSKRNGGCETGILGWARSAGSCFFLSLPCFSTFRILLFALCCCDIVFLAFSFFFDRTSAAWYRLVGC